MHRLLPKAVSHLRKRKNNDGQTTAKEKVVSYSHNNVGDDANLYHPVDKTDLLTLYLHHLWRVVVEKLIRHHPHESTHPRPKIPQSFTHLCFVARPPAVSSPKTPVEGRLSLRRNVLPYRLLSTRLNNFTALRFSTVSMGLRKRLVF